MKIDLSKDTYTQIIAELEFAMKVRWVDCEEGDSTLLMLQLKEAWEEGLNNDPVAIQLKECISPTEVVNALMEININKGEINGHN